VAAVLGILRTRDHDPPPPRKEPGTMTAISVPERLALQQPPRVRATCWTAMLDPPGDTARWHQALRLLLPGWHLADPTDTSALARTQVLLTCSPCPRLLAALPRLQLVQVLGSSAEAVLGAPLPASVRIARTCGNHLVRQAVEYAVAAVMNYHRGFDIYAAQQRHSCIQPLPIRTADERRVGIMGLGRLGSAVAAQLGQLGFRVRGWSRQPRRLPGVDTFHGPDALEAFLRATEILVCLLPLTGQTCRLLDRGVFDALPPGARLVHMGSYKQCEHQDLLAALDDGRLAHATLDDAGPQTLRQHPRVTLTPNVAGRLRPETGAALVARNLQRWVRNEALLDVVDRARGY